MARTLIQVSGLHKHYGRKTIFEDASVDIFEDHRLGVIGRNGAGKSTLCRMILGEEEADAGHIRLHADARIAYLEQKDPFGEEETVLEFLARKSGAPEWRCGELAGQFLLTQELIGRKALSLSGGFQTRVRLCSMLLKSPNFLILDEPTNYLDLKTLLLLEDFLKGFDGGYIVVSHDREFLIRTCTSTLDVRHGKITAYPGDVTAYITYSQAKRQQIETQNAEVRAKKAELEDWVARNKATASKAAQAANRLKQAERLEEIELPPEEASLEMRLPSVETRSGTVLLCQDLEIGYPDKKIASAITFDLDRGSHVAIVGDNGQGKSTFLKTIASNLAPRSGSMKWGYEVRIGTYAQHVFQTLPENKTVRQWLYDQAAAAPGPHIKTQEVLDLAGTFLFRGDDVDKKIGVLSGGERSRLLLCGLLMGRYTCLLLDEPTNHLDFETVEALAAALQAYNGTVFVVSHDRTFIQRIATQVIEVKDGRVTLIPDDYAAYCYRLETEARADLGKGAAAPAKAGAPAAKGAAPTLPPGMSPAKRLKAVEKELKQLDAKRKELTGSLGTTYDDAKAAEMTATEAKIAALEEEWLVLSEQVNG